MSLNTDQKFNVIGKLAQNNFIEISLFKAVYIPKVRVKRYNNHNINAVME